MFILVVKKCRINFNISLSYKLTSGFKFISSKNPVLQTENQFKNKLINDKNIEDRLVYNCVIKPNRVFNQYKIELKQEDQLIKYKKEGAPVIALKYFTEDYSSGEFETSHYPSVKKESIENQDINFPYQIIDSSEAYMSDSSIADVSHTNLENETNVSKVDISCTKPKKSWMKDYNKYAEVSVKGEEGSDEEDESAEVNYGTSDPRIPASNVPCGGCGAHLHCKDPSIPGYVPKEIFVGLKKPQLQAIVCQRCHFLQQYNMALTVTVDPASYPQLLSWIREQYALVILVIDMTDFPCSIWPGILDIVGSKRPLMVVGNKVDLLQDWSKDMLKSAKRALEAQIPRGANVIHTALVSAKTGFGIENLITALYKKWEYRGDVYLVGCTNVGKSMLFNALLQSDYCKSKAVDLVQRATTSPWPGTTLNLLKFPILRPERWRVALRSHRLKTQNINDLRLAQEGLTEVTPQMITQVKMTFDFGDYDVQDEYRDDPFAMPKMETLRRLRDPGSGLDSHDRVFAKSKWLYDTPGVITPDQIIDLLTTEELVLSLPQEPLIPRTFNLFAGQTLFVGGLGRVDYISGTIKIKATVLSAATLPVTICYTEDAAEVYSHYLGSAALAVPCGGPERLQLWPGLQPAKEFSLKGLGWSNCCGDVVLSSAGWMAVTAEQNELVRMQAWTPNARGVHVRIPPVLPKAISVKGNRMFKSPAYALFNDEIKKRRKLK